MHEFYIWCYNMLKVGSGSIQGDATFLEVLDSMSCFVGIVNQVASSKEYFASHQLHGTLILTTVVSSKNCWEVLGLGWMDIFGKIMFSSHVCKFYCGWMTMFLESG